jgi:Ca-activated chloride channel family protein
MARSITIQAWFLVAIFVTFPSKAQLRLKDNPVRADFQVNSGLVLVPVAVVDGRGANIGGLSKENFTVLDDHRPQPITAFYSVDAPCSIGLVVDVSGSVQDRLDWEKDTADAFLELATPEDDFFLATVSSAPAVLTRLSADVPAIGDMVRSVKPGGWTALFDAIHVAADQLSASRHTCRALVVVSDGQDNHSRWTRQELMQFLVESDIQVYTIVIQGTRAVRTMVERATVQKGLIVLNDLAERTGGLSVAVNDTQNPADALHRISEALRNRYVIGYRVPEGGTSDRWHTILIKVDRSKANVYARSGYRAK